MQCSKPDYHLRTFLMRTASSNTILHFSNCQLLEVQATTSAERHYRYAIALPSDVTTRAMKKRDHINLDQLPSPQGQQVQKPRGEGGRERERERESCVCGKC